MRQENIEEKEMVFGKKKEKASLLAWNSAFQNQ